MQSDRLKHYDAQLADRLPRRDPWFLFAVLLWLGTTGLFANIFANSEQGLEKIAVSVALIFTGLWVGHSSQVRGRDRFGDLAILTAVIGCGAGLYTCINDLSIPMTLAEALGALTLMTLISSALLRSRICLIISACVSVAAMIFHFNGMAQSYSLIMFYPAIWILQALYASMLGSRLTVLGMNFIGYFWIIGTGMTVIDLGFISPSLGTSVLFAVGIVHYNIGKVLLSKPGKSQSIHVIFGWTAAISAALIIIYDAFNGLNLVQRGNGATPLGLALWKLIILGSTLSCAVMAFFNHRSLRYRLIQASMAAAACASLPVLIFLNPQISLWISQQPMLDGIPVLALGICAAIMASSVLMILNGVRQHRPSFILIALLAVSALFTFFYKPENISTANGLILAVTFGVFLITARLSAQYNLNASKIGMGK